MSKPGGLKEPKPADADAQHAIDAVKAALEAKDGKKYEVFKAVSYTTQTVAGVNYFVKVNVGSEHIHVRVFRDLSSHYSLHSAQHGKSATDPIVYF
eukprot:TRINITY_DN286_c0_g4_i1.p2 TRINITY_DN286_c0_g4~~TRINITY_DN286_c0_g4_i1.p2  ORF type:complete len:111 (+),score=32.22 TRINITY_DN286_c0_g4_i1:46-333(+)